MAYSKTTWANGTTPAINASNLNKIEQGIYDLSVSNTSIDGALKHSGGNDIFPIEQGYYAITDGAETASTSWCRTVGYVDTALRIKSSPIRMFLQRFEKDGDYAGTWNGTAFSNAYAAAGALYDIDLQTWSKNYPDYRFKLLFYNTGTSINPADIYPVLIISNLLEAQIKDNKSNITSLQSSVSLIETDIDDIDTNLNAINIDLYEDYSMTDVYELGEIATNGNMYITHPTGSVNNRARAKMNAIQKIPSGATSVTVGISKRSIANGKYKVGWAFYTEDYAQISATVQGWFTNDTEFTVSTIPDNAAYFMFYYATNTVSTIDISELDNGKNSVVFNTSAKNYAYDLVHRSKIEEPEELDYEKKRLANIGSNIMFINHRGFNTVAPENTIPAFELSKENGFLYVETDVLFTSDDVPVILHDGTINRTARNADGTELSSTVYINDITYEEALEYDFGIWKGEEYAGTKIPTFDEFMSYCKFNGLRPFIELKDEITYTQSMVEDIIDIVKKYGMLENVWFISFSNDNLTMVKNLLPSAKLALAAGYTATQSQENFMAVINQIIALRTTTNTVVMSGGYQYFNDTYYGLCVSNNIPLIMWTVDSVSAFESLSPCYIGILSDLLSAFDVDITLM